MGDAAVISDLVWLCRDDGLLRYRAKWATSQSAKVPTREEFWKQLVLALLSSQQIWTPGSLIDRFSQTEPFALALASYRGMDEQQVIARLKGFRFARRVAAYLQADHEALFGTPNEWTKIESQLRELAAQVNSPADPAHRNREREVARYLAAMLRGVGPKQSRNILQELELVRYEIPIDSRVAEWLRTNLGWEIRTDQLGDGNIYEKWLDKIQIACAKAEVLPTIFDAAAYDWERIGRQMQKTTAIGYVNRNGQVVIRNTGLPGTDHGQSVYQLACSNCGHTYGANGSDIHLRLCPGCQGGAKGLDYRQ